MTPEGSSPDVVPALVVLGLGYPLVFVAAAAGVSPAERGIASGVASTAQQIGGTAGLAVTTAGTSEVDGLRTALLPAATGIALTAVAAPGFGGTRRAPVPA